MPALIRDGAPVELFPGLPFTDVNGIQRPGNWLELSSSADRFFAGVREVAEPPVAPEGQVHICGPLVIEGEAVVRSYTVEDAPAPGPEPIPEEISDRQFAQALAKLDPPLIRKDEALAFVKRGEVPERLQAAIDAISDPDVRFDVDMQVSGATIFRWSHPTTASLAAALQQSPVQMAALWRFAASLD